MKILLLVPALNAGGVETGTVDLSAALAKKGHAVIVVSSGGELVSALYQNNVTHITLPVHKKSLLTFLQVFALVKIIREEQINVVHAQSRVPAWVAYFACRKTRTPFITSCHGYYSKQFFSTIMGRGERVIAISQVIASHMHDDFGVPEEKIRLVYRGVDLSRYAYTPEKYDAPGTTFRVVNIARLSPLKGHKEFLRAIETVAKKIPHIEVEIVGPADKPDYEQDLKTLVSIMHLEDKVKFLGRRSDIPEILQKADLLVLSTQVPEAFGRVLIEAGAVGTAVCASRIGGITEIIEDGKDGVLFGPRDENSMAEAMLKCANDRPLLKTVSQNLRRKVEGQFSLEHMSEQTLSVYQEAIVRQESILVIKLGGLGDAILAIPSLRALRKNFPKAFIVLLANSDLQPLFFGCPYIDEVFLFERKKPDVFALVSKLKRSAFGVSVDFKNSWFSHLIAFLSGVRERYGFDKGIFSILLNHAIPLLPQSQEGPLRQQARLLEQLRIVGFDQRLELWTTPSQDKEVEAFLAEKGVSSTDTLAGMAIGASVHWPTKDWPIENFMRLSEKLAAQGIKTVLVGDGHSKENAARFPHDRNRLDFVGKTNLMQFVSLIKHVHVLVTPDSSAMHIAAAFGVPIVALFGPTDPKRHLPPAANIDVFVRSIQCQPCYKRTCSYHEQLFCLKEISVEEVFASVMKRLKGVGR